MVIIFFSTLWSLDRLSWVIRKETLPPSGYVEKGGGLCSKPSSCARGLEFEREEYGRVWRLDRKKELM